MSTTITDQRWQVSLLEIAALRALRHAGNYLIGKAGRGHRDRLGKLPRYEVHTELPVSAHAVDEVMAGALIELRDVEPDADCLHELVEDYVRGLLLAGYPHRREYLEAALAHTDCLADVA